MARAGGKGADKSAGKAADKPSKAAGIITVAALTVLALAGGGLTGRVIAAKLRATPPAAETAAEPAQGTVHAPPPYGGDTQLRELPPIVTNLAEPAETRIRLQLAIIIPKKGIEQPDVLAGQVTDDIVAFVKTLSVSALQGASGLQALREDLDDRARTRSDGKVREVVIENLVVQ